MPDILLFYYQSSTFKPFYFRGITKFLSMFHKKHNEIKQFGCTHKKIPQWIPGGTRSSIRRRLLWTDLHKKIQLGNLLKWSSHLDNIHWAKQIYWLFLSANKHIYCWVCVGLQGPCFSVYLCVCPCVCCVFAFECKPLSSSVPVRMTVGLAGGHDCMTIRAPAADLIKVSQSHSSWL